MPISARMQQKDWVIRPSDGRAESFANELKISPLVAQVLINRQITDQKTASVFLNPKLTELIAPEAMPGIEDAVGHIKTAVENKQKITIYGDYDVDGITAVSILFQLFTMLGADVDYYIPHRIDEGYGLNPEAIETLIKQGTELIITVDCGITALESAKLVIESGLGLIITDHHKPGSELPAATAIVHPAIDPDYGNQDSCGAMVAFKLAWAIAKKFSSGEKLEPALREFMLNATSLASMGTIADVMDLRGENRVLTSSGLKALSKCKLTGIKALIETTGLTGQGLDSVHIGFRLAPMLNAAGRMGHARLAVELLTSDNEVRSYKIAEYLKEQNNQRRQCEKKIFKHACEIISGKGLNHPDKKSIVIADASWHSGVIGIVASRIVDKYYRPTVIINTKNGVAQGSGRSIPGFDLLAGISSCSEHLKSFGGHKMAAGIKIETENIEKFAQQLENYARQNLNDEDVVDALEIDALASFDQLSKPTVGQLEGLGPFGQGNPQPMLATKGVRLAAPPRKVGAKSDHLQLTLADNTAAVRCIGFSMGKLEKKLLENEFFNIAYKPQINHFNGTSSVQLNLVDIQFE